MSLTLAQVSVNFLDLYSHKKSTQKSYLSVLTPLLDRLGGTAIDEITPGDIESYLNGLKHLSPGTYNRHRRIIGVLFNYALQEAHILYNPLSRISPRPDRERAIRYLTPAALEELYTRLEGDKTREGYRLKTIVALLHHTGAKVSEILALDLDDVDRDGRIHIRGNRERSLFCEGETLKILVKYIDKKRYKPEKSLFTRKISFSNFIEPLSYPILYQQWNDLVKTSPLLENYHLNDLRHTFAVERINIMPVEHLQILLGHKDIKMTLHYKNYT